MNNKSLQDSSICVVTSMSKSYYDNIGKYCILSIQNYWPKNIDLKVYSEDKFEILHDTRTEVIDWNEKCKKNWENFCGREIDSRCRKFAKKGFSVLQSWLDLDYDFIFWIDADLLTSQPVSYLILDKIINSHYLIGVFDQYYQYNPYHTNDEYLNSIERESWHAESGFFVVNTRHPAFFNLRKIYENIYMADTCPKGLPIWYDGAVLMLSCKNFLNDVHNLSNYRNTHKTQTPINNSWMGDYFQHFKAGNKHHNKDVDFEKLTNLIFYEKKNG